MERDRNQCTRVPGAGDATGARSPIAVATSLLVALCACSRAVGAQTVRPGDSLSARPVLIGTLAEVRARDARLLGATPTSDGLLRSASATGGFAEPGRDGVRALLPDARVVWNQALPFSLNDGSLWAGRGWSALVRAGVDARRGRVRVLLLPELAVAQNRPFDIAVNRRPGRSQLGWPWSDGRADIDLPSRFGTTAWRLLSLGQSAVTVDAGPLAVGVSTENDWWGPGIRNALVLGNNAEGFPHASVRTRRPLRTRLGVVEARWNTGVLTPSLFVDTGATTRWRAISAVAATFTPARLRGLTLGVTRTVVSEVDSRAGASARALDALVRWSPTPSDTARRPAADQYGSLFLRWLVAPARAELYAEWARQGVPRSLRELLLAPHDRGALTVGVQSLATLGAPGRGHLRLQLEATSVEQSIAFRDRPAPPPFYTGLATRDGYTHRGQVLGAAIGPGSSSQWASVALVRPRAEVGVFLGRVRWQNDLMYARPNVNFFNHDVSTLLGARAARRTSRADVALEAQWSRRYNYLFQNGFVNPGGLRTIDVPSVTAALEITPR
jgi:hypothetical protein